jgi:tetratricopeptide (TPR) repeat protein
MNSRRAPLVVRIQRAYAKILRRIARVGTSVVSPIERGALVVLRSTFKLTEKGQFVEQLFARLIFIFLWPFRTFAHIFAATTRVLVPRSIRGAFLQCSSGLSGAAERFGGSLMRAAEWLNLDGILIWAGRLTKPFWYPFVAIGGFFVAWASTRPAKLLLWALPALIVAFPILMATAWGALLGKETIANRYKVALAETLEHKDYNHTQLLERKLSQFGINTYLTEYNTAQALANDGKLNEAYTRMQRLAPLESPGYPLAHVWIIQHLLSGKLDIPSDEVHRLTGIHLDHLATLGIKGPEIDMMTAAWLVQANKLAEAAEKLKPHVHRISSAAVERFRIDLALDRHEQARLDAREVCDHLRRANDNGNSISNHEYESWEFAAETLRNIDESHEISREWLKRYPTSVAARKAVAAMDLREFDQLFTEPNANPVELAERLRTAFALAKATDNMKQRLLVLYQQQRSQPKLQVMFSELAKSSDLPPELAETLGTAAAVAGNLAQAQTFLEMALGQDDSDAVGWNNLAWVLLQNPNPPLEKALAAADKALAVSPKDYRFRQTRGEIFLKLGRWKNAVDDLEYALNGAPDATTIHQSLAQAYEALGNKELASVHRQNAN